MRGMFVFYDVVGVLVWALYRCLPIARQRAGAGTLMPVVG